MLLASCGRLRFASERAPADGSADSSSLDCPQIGDVCADGTVYAGITPDGNVRMFTEASPSYGGGPWSYGNGSPPVTAVLTGMTNTVTGAANTAALSIGGPWQDADAGVPGVQPHDAANYCTDLTANGHTDWYMPALDELREIADHRAAIGNFPPDEYWASNEDPSCPADCAMAIAFPAGTDTSFRNKFDYRALRCVRKN